MILNKVISELKKLQKAGYGKTEVHVLAHDNCEGETQGTIQFISLFEKDPDEESDSGGRDPNLYNAIPNEVVYLHI